MARYTGPVCRLCRRQGEKLFLKGDRCLTPKCAIEGRAGPPGQRGTRRRRVSERGIQLREKQKVKHMYGLMEKQLVRHFQQAREMPGVTGDNFLQILERRLDNVVYRLGFANSRRQARQLVRHGHLAVNDRPTDIPSYLVKPDQQVSWTDGGKKTEYFKMMAEEIRGKPIPEWLDLDTATFQGRMLTIPARDNVGTRIEERLIIEYYSR
ncbi:MAG: 30S ribosomal protein S4 [Dehalococcoidia bacterium]